MQHEKINPAPSFQRHGVTRYVKEMVFKLCITALLLQPLIGHAAEGLKKEKFASITVTGKITDESGQPILLAAVVEKGTTNGVSTDLDGNYRIVVDENAILVISYLGYSTQEVSVNKRTVVNITLSQDVRLLEEVVVIGYGTSKRTDLTTAQVSVSSREIERTVNTTIEQAIQGRASGVYITQNSGQPGGGISVNIRGVNTLNGSTEPLYVIDGVQIAVGGLSFGSSSSSNALAGLNPADIDDIQVLQGPSATAIYGARAANGVILITTKRGKSGQTKFTYGYQHIEQVPPTRLDVMDLSQYAQMVKEFHQVAGGNTPNEFLDPSILGAGTDWQKQLFRWAPMNKHSLGVSGGTDKTKYFISGEYLDQRGIALGSGFKRLSTRVNLDNDLKNWLSLGLNLSFNQTNEKLSTSQENVISNAISNTPQIPVTNIDGTWGGGDPVNGANQFAPVNPIAIASLIDNSQVRRQVLGGANLVIKFNKSLRLRNSVNGNLDFTNTEYYIPRYKIGWAENANSTYTYGSNNSNYWNLGQFLEYSGKIGHHSIDGLVGHEAQASKWRNSTASRSGYLTDNIRDIAAGDETTAGNSGGSGPWAMESFLGRISYNYSDRYYLVGTLRRDGSRNFGPNNRWGWFPSISGAWRISQENFYKSDLINELKIRLEAGTTGNSGWSAGIYSPLSTSATPWGSGFLPNSYSNPDLKWESTFTQNIGLNMGLFKSNLTLEFDYYIKNTDNLLMAAQLPWYMGSNGQGQVAAPTVNVGSMQNKGWGLTINTTNMDRKSFRWETSLNLSSVKTKVTKLTSDSRFIDRVSWWLNDWTQRTSVGNSPWLFRGFIEEGLFQTLDEIEKSAVPVDNNGNRLPTNEAQGIWVGDVKYKDISGPGGKPDGKITEDDLTYIGNPWPKLFGGLTNNFSYKNFDLSILITGTYGNDIYNYMFRNITNPNNINLSRNLPNTVSNYAKPITKDGKVQLANPETNIARISYGPNGNYARITDKWVEDGSFLRLKNVSLSYNVPAALFGRQKLIQGIRATLGVQNLFTITKYTGYDPEVGAYVGRDASASNQAIGLDFGRYPLTPLYTFNLNVNF